MEISQVIKKVLFAYKCEECVVMEIIIAQGFIARILFFLNRTATSVVPFSTVRKLVPGVQYQFRVTATVNSIAGPPSTPTAPVLVKAEICEP